ncbi:MAG TPA: type 1 glutamine amidotransferase domain-containing protein [Candidatus Baltobacteraceae bacterium]
MATTNRLDNLTVAILCTDGVEQVEMTQPRKALDLAGARTVLVSPKSGKLQGWNHDERGDTFPVDRQLDGANPDDFDALVLPGGVQNPDYMRMNPKAVAFVKAFFDAGKPVAAICHGPWMLAEADVIRGKRMTSWPSLQTDLRNAGAQWVDEQVVVSENLVTSRKPDDIPAFNEKAIELFEQSIRRSEKAHA